MKKSGFSVVFAVRLVVTLLIVVFIIFSIIFFTECQLPLSGNLFDEKVLKKCELSWLEKPENVTNEKQYISGDTFYVYECEIDDKGTFENYAQNVFNNFNAKDYTIAHYVEYINAMLNGSYVTVAESDKISDYCKIYNTSVEYTFYYSTQTIEEIKGNSDDRKAFGGRYVRIEAYTEKNERGKYTMKITLYGRIDKEVYLD